MQSSSFETISESPEQTLRLGGKIGRALSGGEIFALTGPLGSGKTHLIKGIAHGAGVTDSAQVNSPTFVIVNEYNAGESGLDLYHIDAYRLKSIHEFEALGFDDLCCWHSVILIEWADKILPCLRNTDYIEIELSHVSENQRKIHIKNAPASLISAIE